MKPKGLFRSFLGIAVTSLLAVSYSHATTYYWDNNGTPSGFGTAGGTWTSPTLDQWTLSGTGTGAPEASVITATTDALNFGNGGTGLGAGTIAVSGTVDSGNMTFASGSGAIVLEGGNINFAAVSTITVNNTADTINSNITGAATSLTKAGTGQLNLTGTNTYTGTTILNAGKIALSGGTVTGSGLTITGSNTALSVAGGVGVASSWDAGNKDFTTGNGTFNNVQVLIDGGGVAGSAKITNVKILNFGRTVTNSTITLTNGGQMNVNGEIRLGNPYYSTAGGANMTIGGGTATSTFTGNNAAFYIGFGERRGSNNNVVTVSSGGVLTGVGNMFVGHVNNTQNAGAGPSTANKLSVTGTGTASMASISVGYSTVAFEANANVVEVTSGGKLTTTSGTNYIGRANATGAQANANTLTVSGVGSSWNAGNQDVNVGNAVASATSNDNILTIGTGATLTNVKNLTVGSGAGTHTGNKLVVNGSVSTTILTVSEGNTLNGDGTVGGASTVSGTLAPGASGGGIGTLTFSNGLALTSTGDYSFELDSGATGSGSADLSNVGGSLALADSVLNLVQLGTYQAGQKFTLFAYSGTPSGTFIGKADDTTFTDAGGDWLINYDDTTAGTNGGTGTSFVTITAIPEPSALLLGAIGFLALLRRRR